MIYSFGWSVPAILLLGLQAAPYDETSMEAERALSSARGAILRADGGEAIRILSGLEPEDLSPDDQAFAACALDRLKSRNPSPLPPVVTSPLVRSLLADYRAYWQDSLIHPLLIDDAQERLIESVSRTLNLTPPDDIAMLEEAIAAHLAADGFHSLQGKTGKLRELMIWRTQSERTHTVELPEGQVTTRVAYLDDFVSGGWSSYLTCNRTGTGGWAKPNALYVVVPRWKSLEDERFQVSFLAHESQHFRDYRTFPDLKGWELEYRAKLVELSMADESRDRLMSRFEANQSDDPSDAHSFANRRVIAAIKRELKLPPIAKLTSASVEDVQIVAKRLLLEDSRVRHDGLLLEQTP